MPNFDYHVERKTTAFDERARKVLNGEALNETSIEEMSAETIHKLFKQAALSNQEMQEAARSKADGDTFTKLFPEYMDTGKNARQFRAFCKATYGTDYPTLRQMETAFNALSENNLIELNPREVARQADSATTERANTIREEAFDEETAMSLPLEEVRRRAGGSGGGWY